MARLVLLSIKGYNRAAQQAHGLQKIDARSAEPGQVVGLKQQDAGGGWVAPGQWSVEKGLIVSNC